MFQKSAVAVPLFPISIDGSTRSANPLLTKNGDRMLGTQEIWVEFKEGLKYLLALAVVA